MLNEKVQDYRSSVNTAEILVDKLISWKVKFIFGLVGDGINPIFEALRKRKDDIRLITVRHEESAAFMASGYAKSTGNLGVCIGTSGPGAVHLMNGLYDAAMEGAPVLAITGAVPHDVMGTQFIQEVDTVQMLQPIAVFNQLITGPVHAQTIVDLACRAALSKPGVAHLAVATDIQMQSLSKDKHSEKGGDLVGSTAVVSRLQVPVDSEIQKAADLINASAKIMILAGRGALGAGEQVLVLAEQLQAPITKALLGKTLTDDNSPYTTGGIGRLGTLTSKKMMEDCELLLILGSNMPYLDYYPKPGKAKAIQIDFDPSRIGLRYPVQIGLAGDVKETLKLLLPKLKKNNNASFLASARERMADWRKILLKLESDTTIPIKPPHLVSVISRLVEEDAHISVDTGAHTLFTARHLQIKETQQMIVCGTLASMGPGLPYVIAAQLAYPERQCIAIVGDGGFTMLMGDLATAVLYNLPVKIIIFKNNTLAMDKFEQEEIGAKEYGIALHPIDFVKVAEAFGAEAYHCDDPANLETVLKTAFASTRPTVVEVDVDPNTPAVAPEDL